LTIALDLTKTIGFFALNGLVFDQGVNQSQSSVESFSSVNREFLGHETIARFLENR